MDCGQKQKFIPFKLRSGTSRKFLYTRFDPATLTIKIFVEPDASEKGLRESRKPCYFSIGLLSSAVLTQSSKFMPPLALSLSSVVSATVFQSYNGI